MIGNQQQTMYDRYKREIYRIGWRVQYRAKKIKTSELPIFESDSTKEDFTVPAEDMIVVKQLFKNIPKNGRVVLEKMYLYGFSEAEVAQELNISQQAVNKCKRKMLKLISQKASLWN
ncbi:ECF-type sigma factor [Paenibacillus dakarensis]|uniref:ECF-type sigma factor n=1 Tax=Paenibacillus dakarensis TaxID=1527293 RepID=UPI0006D57AFF|nr:ECF-type sigma factor [Paenibacillus dakarensis]